MSIQPRLGFFDLTMIVISLVIGIGIFRTPQIVAQKAGSPGIFFLLVVINAGSSAGVALIGTEYINPVLPASLSASFHLSESKQSNAGTGIRSVLFCGADSDIFVPAWNFSKDRELCNVYRHDFTGLSGDLHLHFAKQGEGGGDIPLEGCRCFFWQGKSSIGSKLMDLSYILNELGEERETFSNAVVPPIFQTSNFAFPDVSSLRKALLDEYETFVYSRGQNPTLTILRKKLAALDGAEDALVFSSGMAAIFCAVFANVQHGDHIISVAKPYSWTHKLFSILLPRFGVTTTMVDGTQIENFEKAIQRNTKILYLESPNSFTFELQDLKAAAALGKSRGILTMVDNSYCSPLYQQPVAMGIDITLQTASKYIGGHSDLLAGVLCGSRELIKKIFSLDMLTIGSVTPPFHAWLLLRSLRTIEVRLERISKSTETVAARIEQNPKIEKIYYPFSTSHPQHELARRQMKRAPGLFSVALRVKSLEQIETFCNSLRRFLRAVSWGGHESLVFPACASIPAGDFDPNIHRHRLVRFYIGLEDPAYLIHDIEQALTTI